MDTRSYQLVLKRNLFCFELVVFEAKKQFLWLYVSLEMRVAGFSFLLALAYCAVLSKSINFTKPVPLR